MQSRASSNEHATKLLQDAAARVAAVARVHRNFYSSDADEVSALAFLRRLGADLSDICDQPIDVSGDEGNVPTTLIQPIGLIANEFVTNAIKHGTGRIGLNYKIDGAEHALSVCDRGLGPAADLTAGQHRGLGMKVIETLTRQLKGDLTAETLSGGRGFCITVKFPG